MLHITQADVRRSGGVLAALSEVSAAYVSGLLQQDTTWRPADSPERLITHRAPHLDDYVAEFLFRAALPPVSRLREFVEVSVHARDDTAARTLWPDAAVFGIGSTVECGRYAQYLFDEHQSGGGRTVGSCARLVADRCFRRLPASLTRILGEVDAIDSRGGAHAMHLNNLLKTCHLVQYSFGRNSKGRSQSGGLTPTWKRAIVNAMLAAVVYCLENGIDLTVAQPVQKLVREFLDKYEQVCPYKWSDKFSDVYEHLRSNSGSVVKILETKVHIDGINHPQLLVAPFLAQAATIAWGKEIAYFLMVPLWEAEILGNLHFRRAEALLERSFLDRDKPKTIYTSECSMGGRVISRLRVTGKQQVRGKSQTAPHPSPIWILGCRHNNFLLQPNKAMRRFLTDHNFGVGLIWSENTAESTKAVFRGDGFPQALWLRLIEALKAREPDLWYQPVETAPFIINGNAAHRYQPLSALTPATLARLCVSV